jgi:hypothetical protein
MAGTRVAVPPGQVIKVGRLTTATLVIPNDRSVANLHFAVEWDGPACRVRDLYSDTGTLVNGTRTAATILKDGDQIVAGKTTCVFRMSAEAAGQANAKPPPTGGTENQRPGGALLPAPGGPPAAAPAVPERVLRLLRQEKEPLFALLDAARDLRLFTLLRECGEEHQSLYEGIQGEKLALCAPYLVRLPRESRLLETLVWEGWGRSWGVYLSCPKPFQEVRKHFRRFLLVKTEEGKELYFRFYDPRVLRVFLPTCTGPEAGAFFGPTRCFWLEAEKAEILLRFTASVRPAEAESVPLDVA